MLKLWLCPPMQQVALEVKHASLLLVPTSIWLPLLLKLAACSYIVLLRLKMRFLLCNPRTLWLIVLDLRKECLEH